MAQSPAECNPSMILQVLHDGEKLPSSASEDQEMEIDHSVMIQVVENTVEVGTSNSPTCSQVPQYATLSSQSFYAQNGDFSAPQQSPQLPSYEGIHVDDDCTGRQELKPLEDMSEVNEIIKNEVKHIPVKRLRSIIPRLRVACYYSEEDICGKKKVKNLWSTRPQDWPAHVPFKDPNNKDKEQSKPSKDDLVKMFQFLKSRYCSMQPVEEPNTVLSTQGSARMVASSQPVTYPTDDLRRIMEEEKQPLPFQEHPQPILMPFPVKQERVAPQERKDSPLYDLRQRIKKKKADVQKIVHDDSDALKNLTAVDKEVVGDLFHRADRIELSCAFLDAGHQFETLLDVVLTFGKEVAIDMLKQGCQELLDKFAPMKDEQTQSSFAYQGAKAVYTSLVNTNTPSTLAPATGDHFIPRISDLRAKQVKQEPASPASSTFNLEELAISIKSPCSAVDISNLVETREGTQGFMDTGKEGKDGDTKAMEAIEMEKFVANLLGVEGGQVEGQSGEVLAVMDEEGPVLQDRLLTDVLALQDDYGVRSKVFDVSEFDITAGSLLETQPITTATSVTQLVEEPVPSLPVVSPQAPAISSTEQPQQKFEVLLTPAQLQQLVQTQDPVTIHKLLSQIANKPPLENALSPPSIPQTVMDICDDEDNIPVVSGGKRQHSSRGGRIANKRGRHQ